jgi:hypothetical protein
LSLLVHLFPSSPPAVVPDSGWIRETNIPTRRIRRTAEYREFTTDLRPVVSFSWFQGLSEPTRRKKRPPYYPDFSFAPGPIVSFSWFESLKEPYQPRQSKRYSTVLSSSSGLTYQQFVPDPTVFAGVTYNAGPTFTKTVLYQAYAIDPYSIAATPEDVALDKWFSPFTEPVKPKVGLRASLQQFLGYDPYPITPFVYDPSVLDWFHPLGEPRRFKRGLSAGSQLFSSFHPNPIVTFSYFQGLSEPKRYSTKLKAAWLPFAVSSTDIYPSPPSPPVIIQPDTIGPHEYFPWHNKDGLTVYFSRKAPVGRKRYFPVDIERQDVLVRKRNPITATVNQELDWDIHNFFDVSITQNVTFIFSNPRDNSDFVVLLTNDSGGVHTITWPPSLVWPDGNNVNNLNTAGEAKLIRISYFGGVYRATLY